MSSTRLSALHVVRRWRSRRASAGEEHVVVLSDDDLPAMFRATDEASKEGRDSTYVRSAAYLIFLVFAAVGPLLAGRAFDKRFNYGAAVSVAFFGLALVVVLSTAARKPEVRWYRGRAGAESVKSLAWCYAVGADPFPLSIADAREGLQLRLAALRHELADLDWSTATGDQISPAMDSLRGENLETRKAQYLAGRLAEQEHWYATKAEANEDAAFVTTTLVVLACGLGALCGLAELIKLFTLDGLGLCAAAAAALVAWAQLKQHRTYASAYAIAVQDLALARETIKSANDEASWAKAAAGVEDAVSREHTMWLARYGQRQLSSS